MSGLTQRAVFWRISATYVCVGRARLQGSNVFFRHCAGISIYEIQILGLLCHLCHWYSSGCLRSSCLPSHASVADGARKLRGRRQRRLAYAALTGDEKGLEKYLAKGIPVDVTDKKRFTLLGIAILTRNKNAALLLLKHGANPNPVGAGDVGPAGLAIRYARDKNDTFFLEMLLKHGADPNVLIDDAITINSLPMVKLLVAAGADVNARDSRGDTYLLPALSANAYDIVYYLLGKGVNPKINDEQLTLILEFVNDDLAYQPPPDDCRPKVIDWLKQHNEWKDKSELWKEKQARKASESKQSATP